MIVRKSLAHPANLRIGQSGDFMEAAPDDFGVAFYGEPFREDLPISAPPLRPRRLARVGMIATPRCMEGFAWHNACHALTPANWRHFIENARPYYLLVESCVYDSERAWPLLPYAAERLAVLGEMATFAAQKGTPAIFWHTLGPEMLPYFEKALPAFAIIACADEVSLDILQRKGLPARLLRQAFSPERFNPLTGIRLAPPRPRIVFDGVSRLARHAETREIASSFMDKNLAVVDSGSFTPPYNFRRSAAAHFAPFALGAISHTAIHDLYKNSGAYLSISTDAEGFAPAWEQRALEAAACRIPVLHVGNAPGLMPKISRVFSAADQAAEYWRDLLEKPLEAERAGHLAWRASHREHTFARRMATIHEWLNLGGDPFPMPVASVVTPSMRPENFTHVLAQYEVQNWPAKEWVYVFHGLGKNLPVFDRPDVRIVHVQPDHHPGLAMNAGIMESSGEYFFRMDDDDILGPDYLADRMIHFREFDINTMCNARVWMAFTGEEKAYRSWNESGDDTIIAIGSATYSLLHFNGASMAAKKDFALRLGLMEAANAHADVSFWFKAMFHAPASAHLMVDSFNMLVMRNIPSGHTWGASRDELEQYFETIETPKENIFV